MTSIAMRSLSLGHIPQWSGGQILGDRPHRQVCGVDASPVETARPTSAFASRGGLIVTKVVDLTIRQAEYVPMGVGDLPLDAQPPVAIRLDVRRIPGDTWTVNHASSVALFGRLDGKPVLPDFTEGSGSI